MQSKVQIIILQYNNSDSTIKCLNSLLVLNYGNFKVLVVDNASETEDAKKISDFISNHSAMGYELKVMNLNLGYSSGNNYGIKYALENQADYIWVLNNDVFVEKDSLSKLIEVAEKNPSIGILSPVLDEGDKKVYGGKIKWLKAELSHSIQKLENNQYIPGTAMLLRTEIVKKIGFLDERYFLYFEDAEYSLRAQKAGYELMTVEESLVHHDVSSTTKKLGSPILLRYHYRNAHIFNAKYAPWWVVVLLPVWSFFIIIRQLAKIIFIPGKRDVSKAIAMGVVDFYFGRHGKIHD